MNAKNTLLSRLPEGEYAEILPKFDRMWLAADKRLLDVEERADYVYFPETCIVAVIARGEARRNCYIGYYGFEGCGSLAPVLGIQPSGHIEIVQFAGFAHRIPVAELHDLLGSMLELRRVLMSYVHIFMMQISCTMLSHGTRVEQRLARLLLMYQDRARANRLAVTHQRLSAMLGVRRSGITEAVHLLESDRLIRAERGMIEILDRARLEALTGGCYGRAEEEYRRLI